MRDSAQASGKSDHFGNTFNGESNDDSGCFHQSADVDNSSSQQTPNTERSDTTQDDSQSDSRSKATQPPRSPSIASWVSFTLSSLLLAGVIGLVGYLWISDRQQQPPILQTISGETRQSGEQFYVAFTVHNAGGQTASAVQVVAELKIGSNTIEQGEQIFDSVSSQEQVTGAFVFSRDPQQGTLVIRVASYRNP